jgi:hypothetical protein
MTGSAACFGLQGARQMTGTVASTLDLFSVVLEKMSSALAQS